MSSQQSKILLTLMYFSRNCFLLRLLHIIFFIVLLGCTAFQNIFAHCAKESAPHDPNLCGEKWSNKVFYQVQHSSPTWSQGKARLSKLLEDGLKSVQVKAQTQNKPSHPC